MNSSHKKALFINLENRKFELKTYPDYVNYLGGVALGLKLLDTHHMVDPLIFSVGPLNGYFPFASKCSVLFILDKKIEDLYLGGYLGSRIKFCDIDSIVIYGKSQNKITLDIQNESVTFLEGEVDTDSLGLPGKRTKLELVDKKIVLDEYFTEAGSSLAQKMGRKNIGSIVITGTKSFDLPKTPKYQELVKNLIRRSSELEVEKGFFPSCAGCPMGCEKSKTGERGGNILSHSMVACTYAEKIYSDVGTVFSCLNVLGYDYTHEDIQNLPNLVKDLLSET